MRCLVPYCAFTVAMLLGLWLQVCIAKRHRRTVCLPPIASIAEEKRPKCCLKVSGTPLHRSEWVPPSVPRHVSVMESPYSTNCTPCTADTYRVSDPSQALGKLQLAGSAGRRHSLLTVYLSARVTSSARTFAKLNQGSGLCAGVS